MRLGQAEGAEHVAARQRLEEAFLLVVVAEAIRMLHTGQLLTLTMVLVAPSPAAISSRITRQRQVVQAGAVPLGRHGHAVAAELGQALAAPRAGSGDGGPSAAALRRDAVVHIGAHGVLHSAVVVGEQHGVASRSGLGVTGAGGAESGSQTASN